MSVHEAAKQIRTGQYVPDILDCLAQLSNDQVPTPPKLARAMLDILPDEVWGQVDYKWLDPFCKSGIFLREVAARLLEGLSEQIPDFEERRDHIYRNMLWGTSITEMTGMISRRSLYYSRDASGPASVITFNSPAGNLPFIRAHHTFPKKTDGTVTGGCKICGAPLDLERGEGRENYAYSFIHGAYPTEEMKDMKFDVIVGNPPYQIDSDGNTRTKPVYQLFVEQAIALNPRYVLMITPSRWFAGGLGLDEFRQTMLKSRKINRLVDYPAAAECFPGVEIKGGVSYFLWDRVHNGPCEVTTLRGGVPGPTVSRSLAENDVFVRFNEAISILQKVAAKGEPTLSEEVEPRVPFGMQANFKDYERELFEGAVTVYGNKFVGFTTPNNVTKNRHLVDTYKVIMSVAYNGGDALPHQIVGRPIVAGPGQVCTDTYLLIRTFESAAEAENFSNFLRTRIARFLIALRKITQHTKPSTFKFVPTLAMDRAWTDEDLIQRYGITPEEVAFIESQVRLMPATGATADD